MANRRFGWHSGSVNCRDLAVANDLVISGDLSFGDASTDTLTINGAFVANGDSTIGSGNGDTIAIGSGTDSVSVGVDLAVTSDISAVDAVLSGSLGVVDIVASGNVGAVNAVLSGTLGVVDIVASGNIGAVNGVLSGTLGVTGAIDSDAGLSGASLALDGADEGITYGGTNTTSIPALILPDDTFIADANGVLGSTAGFVVIDIGGANYKLQTYAMA